MSAYQFLWTILCLPILAIYAVAELIRGWRILRYGEKSLNIALRLRILLMKVIRGEEAAHEYQAGIENNMSAMKLRGINSLLFGIISIVLCVLTVLDLMNIF